MHVTDASDTSIFSLNCKSNLMAYSQHSVYLLIDASFYT